MCCEVCVREAAGVIIAANALLLTSNIFFWKKNIKFLRLFNFHEVNRPAE